MTKQNHSPIITLVNGGHGPIGAGPSRDTCDYALAGRLAPARRSALREGGSRPPIFSRTRLRQKLTSNPITVAILTTALCCLLIHAAPGQQTTAESAQMTAGVSPDGGRIVIEARGVKPDVKPRYTANVAMTIRAGVELVSGSSTVKVKVVEGQAEVVSLGLSGSSTIVAVTSETNSLLTGWAVREASAGGARMLDLRFDKTKPLTGEITVVVTTLIKEPVIPGAIQPALLTRGEAIGFSSTVSIAPEPGIEIASYNATELDRTSPAGTTSRSLRFHSTEGGTLSLMLAATGAAPKNAELFGMSLSGNLDETAKSLLVRMKAEARVTTEDARLRLLSGVAALSEFNAPDGCRVELVRRGRDSFHYEAVFDRPGTYALDVAFAVPVREGGDWRSVEFTIPSGAVVPLQLAGWKDGVTFDPLASVVPGKGTPGWLGYLPANGAARIAWKRGRDDKEGKLFFTTAEQTDVQVGSGLLRQHSHIGFRILQGKLPAISIRVDGPGEILGVQGASVAGWKVSTSGSARTLDVQLSRPMETEGELEVMCQSALEKFPVRAEPIRLTPTGAVRHSGYVRISNRGAVRLEIADANGLMQLAPNQFPGEALGSDIRQTFVYRFPSATYSYRIVADQILPEVSVSQILIYELAEADRIINADIELDIREAPLREWSPLIPADYSVVSVTAGEVSDYVAESATQGDLRPLKILFTQPVIGRQLIKLRLEKNEPAGAGDWNLPPIRYPNAKTVRGYVGVVSAAGYRIVAGKASDLAEVPLSYFPKQTPGLQQAFRVKEPNWTADVKIEARGQTIQADVFHLYSVKEGVVYGSVLLNYFVVGAPANEWRIEIPEAVGNIDVVGQNVGKDWRRDGKELRVTLHQPVLGAATVLVTFEKPMSARGGPVMPGEVRPIGVQSERGYVQVVSPLQVKHRVVKAEGLLKLEALELPTEYRLLSTSPSLAVYQYTARPFDLEMNVEWYESGETVEQIVDFATLASRVSREGQVVTEATFFVKTRGRKALRLSLPEPLKLWKANVDGEPVTARTDEGQTLVPLPPRLDPNQPVKVALEMGQAAKDPGSPTIMAPALLVPTVISEWKITADSGRVLVPKRAKAELASRPLTETGLDWISRSGLVPTVILLALMFASVGLLKRSRAGNRVLAFFVACLVFLISLVMAASAFEKRSPNTAHLTYSAAVIPAGEALSIEVGNVPSWLALISVPGIIAVVAGVVAIAGGLIGVGARQGGARWIFGLGIALIIYGLLAQRGGAILFYLFMVALIFAAIIVPSIFGWYRSSRNNAEIPPGAGMTPAAWIVALMLIGLGSAHAEKAAPDPWAGDKTRAAESIAQTWRIQEKRLFGEIEVRVRGKVGDSFLLLVPPAVLTEFNGDGLHIAKVVRGDQVAYCVVPERDGMLVGRAKFEMPVESIASGIPVTTGPAAMQKITIDVDQSGWEFVSPLAAYVIPASGLASGHSGSTIILAPGEAPRIDVRPRSRDVSTEEVRFFAEIANLYLPGPGVVNGRHRVTVRPAQGEVTELSMEIPEGFTVGDVGNGPVGTWRFDPGSRLLRVSVEPAQAQAFAIDVETQLGTEALPVDVIARPLRVRGAAGEVGMIGLAFGGDAQPENIKPTGLSPVNSDDFSSDLIPRSSEGAPVATLQNVFRYGAEPGQVDFRVAAVAPEVRVTSKQVISIGDDRMVLAADLSTAITRAGVFKLSFDLPPGLDVESLTGPSLNHWTEAEQSGTRTITMHLNGRTIGTQNFAVNLTGATPPAQAKWVVPRLILSEATRQTGTIMLVPEKGILLSAVERDNASQLDPRTIGGSQPNTLAFRLLQNDWKLTIGIEALDPWVTVQALQEITAREGQTLTRINARYKIENAAVKRQRVKLPKLTEDEARTVRATGPAVGEMVKVDGEEDMWEIQFRRGVAGETAIEIEYQSQTAQDDGKKLISVPEFPGARLTQYVAVRAGGRLELEAGVLPRGWKRSDWTAVPANLQNQGDRSVPVMCFRVAESEGPLEMKLKRHAVAEALKLRVTSAQFTSLLSVPGPNLTSAELQLDVIEKSSLKVWLPPSAELYNTFVNGESMSVVRDGDAYLFHVSPNTSKEQTASVRFTYAVTDAKRSDLSGPRLSVPMENVTWRVVVPPGRELSGYSGGFRLREERAVGTFALADYLSWSSSRRVRETQKANALLEEASQLLQQGQQDRAGEMLSKAANGVLLDQAANEDARVQFRALKEQQAVVGLNTRRQKLYLDNRSAGEDAIQNKQLEEAANINPFMQGKQNYDPQQLDQLLMGNTADENSALRVIAQRLVDQQLAAEPAPGTIDVTLPERGKVLTFTRSLQVDGSAPLMLNVKTRSARATNGVFILFVLGACVVLGRAVIARPGKV